MGNANEKAMNRRSFIGLAAMAGMGALTGGLLVGCASDQPRNEVPAEEPAEEPTAQAPQEPAADTAPDAEAPAAAGGKTLVAVFSWSGHTLQVAERVHDLAEGDFFHIEPAEAYTTDYDEVLEVAQRQQDEDFIPPLAQTVANWDEYDTVYLGYPVWWYHIPQTVKGFLQQHDLAGKTVHPFCTSGGTSISGTLNDIRSVCPDAQLSEGLTIDGDAVAASLDRVDAWVAETGTR